MTIIRPLAAEDAAELLAFERENREWFRATVGDRGDLFFAEFADRHEALLAEQACGTSRFFLVRGDDGVLVGRVNLVDIADEVATLGYRLGLAHVGRGHAKAAVRLVLREAAALGIAVVRASVAEENLASQRVLAANGFVPVAGGPATVEVGGQLRALRHVARRLRP